MAALPITIIREIDGGNGRNWPGVVMIDPSARHPAAVWAQEAWEALFKLNPVDALRVALNDRHRRQMEYMGHEVEVQAARMIYGEEETSYRQAEAAAMRRGYDGLFSAVPLVVIEAAMMRKKPKALQWVASRRREIEAWGARLSKYP